MFASRGGATRLADEAGGLAPALKGGARVGVPATSCELGAPAACVPDGAPEAEQSQQEQQPLSVSSD